jgi:YggT family protein
MQSFIFNLINSLVSIYLILLSIRVLLTWFHFPQQGPFFNFLCRSTDPYLDWFKRFSFFRLGSIDFSPVLAFIALIALLQISNAVIMTGKISLGLVLAVLTGALWNAAALILNFLILLTAIRAAGLAFRFYPASPFWAVIDSILKPVYFRITGLLFRQPPYNYMVTVAASGVFLLIVSFAGSFAVNQLLHIMRALPF